MWDLPRPGLEPASPALAGRFSTTAPPGKPKRFLLLLFHDILHCRPLTQSSASQTFTCKSTTLLIRIFWFRWFGICPKFCISNKLPRDAGPRTTLSVAQSLRKRRRKPCSSPVLGAYRVLIPRGIWYRDTGYQSICFKECPSLYVLPLISKNSSHCYTQRSVCFNGYFSSSNKLLITHLSSLFWKKAISFL